MEAYSVRDRFGRVVKKGVRIMLRKKEIGLFVLVIALVSVVFLKQDVYGNGDKAIHVIQTNPANMELMLQKGEIDGFVAWEPFNAQAIEDGTGKYLLQSGEIWQGHPCCLLAISSLEADSDVELALVWAHVKATQFIHDPCQREKVLEYAMRFSGKDKNTVEKALQHIEYVDFPDEKQVRGYYDDLSHNGLLTKKAKDLKYADDDTFFKAFLYKKYVHMVEDKLLADPNWIPPQVNSSKMVSLGYLSQDLHELAFYVAEQEGFYRQVGLSENKNLEIKVYNNGVAVMEAFKAQELTASYVGCAPAILKRVNDNVKINIIAGANNEGSALVVKADSGIASLDDLAGKTIAVPALGSVQHFVLDKAVRKNKMILRVD